MKWAILQIDDGHGRAEGAAFAKVWEKCQGLETKVDQLVMVCGEIAHKVSYAKDDVLKEHPQVGDIGFTVKEAYLLEDALPLVSKGLHIRLRYEDADLAGKAAAIANVISKNPGKLPVFLDILYKDRTVVNCSLGVMNQVAVTLSFLSELDKIVPQADTSYAPDGKIYLEVREPRPWER